MSNATTYSPAIIANYFLERAAQEGRALTPMQLLKLVYIAHGFNLGYGRGRLINEEVQAWRYGPVIQSLYNQIKRYGPTAVSEPLQTGLFPWIRDSKVDATTASLLDHVWGGYGFYSGIELSEMTHRQGSPWWIEWNERGGSSKSFAVIDDELIRSFYESKIAQAWSGQEEAQAMAQGQYKAVPA